MCQLDLVSGLIEFENPNEGTVWILGIIELCLMSPADPPSSRE